jgi:flagellar hook-associated protein 3 FlgL
MQKTQVQLYKHTTGSSTEAVATGTFNRDVAVRIDSADPVTGDVRYSYSLDDGANWLQGTAPAGSTRLSVPGGFLDLTAGAPWTEGDQFIISPRRADINFEIAPGQTITVNMVGKDIFGGLFQQPFGPSNGQPVPDNPEPVEPLGQNLFEVVGKLIAAAEVNSQQGFQEALADLRECEKRVLTKAADVGGRINRLDVAFETLTMRELDETDAMSKIADVDVTTLMTKLAQQQIAYNTVLKSSSMIMQMNLMNFI